MRIFYLLILLPLLYACTGDEHHSVDTVPPLQPSMIPHEGDLGDGQIDYTIETPDGFQNVIVVASDENNGIDAVPDANWMRLQWWSPLPDDDIDYLNIWRFRQAGDGIVDLTMVDSVRYDYSNPPDTYLDQSLGNGSASAVGNTWYYYIEAVDQAGNRTASDTVGYHLVEKAILMEPGADQTIANGSNVVFTWLPLMSDSVSRYRVILFNASMDLLWSLDVNDTDPETNYLQAAYENDNGTGTLTPGQYYWRVDVFTSETDPPGGSESMEIPFTYGN
jgi:hypothetical protein